MTTERLDQCVMDALRTEGSQSLGETIILSARSMRSTFSNMIYRILLVCFSVLAILSPNTQAESDHNTNLWLHYFGDHPINETPWLFHLDTQIRRADSGRSWQQFLIQPGIAYQLNDKINLGGGYGYMETEPYGDHPLPFELPEHRVYEQVSVSSKLFGIDWQHRFRLEQRFLGTPASDPIRRLAKDFDYRFENRIRYRLQTVFPIQCFGQDDLYLRLYDEAFVNVGSEVLHNHFDQNRAYIGVGKRLLKHLKCELGFMEQTLQHRDGQVWENNHTLMFSLSSGQPLN